MSQEIDEPIVGGLLLDSLWKGTGHKPGFSSIPLVAQDSAKKLRKLGRATPPAGLAAWLHSAGGRQILILNNYIYNN